MNRELFYLLESRFPGQFMLSVDNPSFDEIIYYEDGEICCILDFEHILEDAFFLAEQVDLFSDGLTIIKGSDAWLIPVMDVWVCESTIPKTICEAALHKLLNDDTLGGI